MSKVMRLSVSTIEKHVGKGKQICRTRLAKAQRDKDPILGAIFSALPVSGPRAKRESGGELLLAAE
jgi:hypothetical protein